MEDGDGISVSFASNSLLSDVFSSYNEAGTSPRFLSLSKLSSCFEKLVGDSEYDYNDAEIEVDGVVVGVIRGILAARSPFFHVLFKNADDNTVKNERLKFSMSDLVPNGRIEYEALMVILHYLYTGTIKDFPKDVSTCVDGSCAHDACGPAIHCAVQMMYASVKFQIKDLVMVVQGRLINFVEKACVEDIIPILIVAFHCELKQLFSRCVQKIAWSTLDDIVIEKELPELAFTDIKSLRVKSKKQGSDDSNLEANLINEKDIWRIRKALDTGDIEFVDMLLRESDVTLDAACALHYAAAYCNTKTMIGLLNLKKADVNLRNARGYTVLHIAARRKDPSVVIELLEHDAYVHDTTPDGQTSLTLCRRLTRPKDFSKEKKHGEVTNKDRLCIEMLERKMCLNPPAGNVSDSAMVVAQNVLMGLLYYENRVALARRCFPLEAALAMQVAEAASTTEFIGLSAYEDSDGTFGEVYLSETTSEFSWKHQQNLLAFKKTVALARFIPSEEELEMQVATKDSTRESTGALAFEDFAEVDFNVETTSEVLGQRQQRLLALQRTVETGRRYFPNCSEFLDSLLLDESLGTLLLDNGTPEETIKKRARYMEIGEGLVKALDEDKAKHKKARRVSSSCSASSSSKGRAIHKVDKR
ncbi:hypothetical protein F511_31283 [Dorcoceras hygrometricum]|uniref:Uncharacterized protein n=1 Tax=Dorcoceras hygrometricum TaxID=472368 RepID=A0A2Z7CGT0_9LAMI|nr:hypothetical protein F511_31283 [Dorcoceras hygrometricum]